jgi:RNA polymerase sigma-70 factor (ECF subfamily)
MNSALLQSILLLFLFAASGKEERQELYKAIKNGDQRAFKSFYDANFEKLFIYLKNRGIQSDAAEDIIQKAFIYIWENRQKIDSSLSLRAYIYRIAYTRMLNYLDQKKEAAEWDTHVAKNERTPQDDAEYSDLRSSFKQALKQMPERRRAVFEHCFIHELTYKETAEVLSISPKTVENHMALAFKDMRASLYQFQKK